MKSKYFNSHDYIFNPVPFIISLEDSHFGLKKKHVCLEDSHFGLKKKHVCLAPKKNPKEIGADISIFHGSSVLQDIL